MTGIPDNKDPFLRRKTGGNPLTDWSASLASWIGNYFAKILTLIDRPPIEFIRCLDGIGVK